MIVYDQSCITWPLNINIEHGNCRWSIHNFPTCHQCTSQCLPLPSLVSNIVSQLPHSSFSMLLWSLWPPISPPLFFISIRLPVSHPSNNYAQMLYLLTEKIPSFLFSYSTVCQVCYVPWIPRIPVGDTFVFVMNAAFLFHLWIFPVRKLVEISPKMRNKISPVAYSCRLGSV